MTGPQAGRLAAAAVAALLAAAACEDDGVSPEERVPVTGRVLDVQSNTRLNFYDEDLNPLDVVTVPVRQDGTFGPLMFPRGTFLGAATASGFTSGAFSRFTIAPGDTALELEFDLDPITIPLAVGARWTYDEVVVAPTPESLTVTVEITGQQPGANVPAVFTVEERRTDATGGGETEVYFLAQDAQGIRKSADATIDAADELLLRLPATLGTTWSTVDFESGVAVDKVLTGFRCDEQGCVEVNDFTIAEEPAGIFMTVAVRHALADGRAFVTLFSDVGIVDAFEQDPAGNVVRQRKLRAFQPPAGG